jgi:SnoaL-like domain
MNHITAEDFVEIHNLVARYCVATDNADADGFMQTWVEPADFGGHDSDAFGKLETWDAMLAFEKEHVGPGGMANGKRHLSLNIVIEPVSPTEVHVTNDMVVLEVAEIPKVLASGRYNRSVVVKTSDGWRFKRRTLDIDAGFIEAMAEQTHAVAAGSDRAGT